MVLRHIILDLKYTASANFIILCRPTCFFTRVVTWHTAQVIVWKQIDWKSVHSWAKVAVSKSSNCHRDKQKSVVFIWFWMHLVNVPDEFELESLRNPDLCYCYHVNHPVSLLNRFTLSLSLGHSCYRQSVNGNWVTSSIWLWTMSQNNGWPE